MPALPQLHPLRFTDLTAAIKAMARRFPSRQLPAEWAKVIQEKPHSADTWEEVFAQHTDLFRVRDDGCIVLRDRHHLPPFLNVTTKSVVTQEQFNALTEDQKETYDRPPLTEKQLADVIVGAGEAHQLLLLTHKTAVEVAIAEEAAALKEELAKDESKRGKFQSWLKSGGELVGGLGTKVLGLIFKAHGGL